MNPNEITCLSQLNLQFMCFEPDPISIPITQDEIDEQDYRRMCLDDLRSESDMERRSYEDDRFDNDNEDARREQDEWDREHETGDYDYRND